MRQALSLTVHLRAIVAAALALGFVLAIATLAWAAPALSIDAGPSGPTDDTTPLFGFTVDVSATTVECSIDEGTPAYGACSGAASHAPDAPLPDGAYVFRVRASDGVEETVATQPFSVDTAAPSVSIDSGPAGPVNDAVPVFGFTAEAGATVECSIDEGTPAYGPCSGAASHAPDAPLPDGAYAVRVRATDAAGNQAVATQPFSVDTAAPSVSIDSGPAGPTNDRTPSFAFTAEPGATVACSVDQGTPAYGPCSGPSSHTAATPADGSYVFHVRATDAAGNQAAASRAFDVDTVAPAVGVTSGPTVTSDSTPSFGFTTDADSAECSLDEGAPSFAPCTSPFTPVVPLPDGSYTFRVRATDRAGNQASDTQPFTVDSAAPNLTIGFGPPEATNDTTPSFGFTTDAQSVECSLYQGSPSFASCASPFTPVVPLPDGTYTFSVRATDRAANESIETRTFTVDTAPPSLSIGFGPSGTTTDSTPLFGFSAEADATVACSIDQGAPAFGPCASTTAHAAGAPLADGAYVFRVRATDAAGNQVSVTRAFTVDTVQEAPDPQPPGPESPRPDPTPLAPPAATLTTPAPSAPLLLSPFPLVRISGTLTAAGARIRLLTVRASPGTLVRVTVTPGCSGKRRPARRCRVLSAAATVGKRGVIGFSELERAYRSGTVIVVRVWRPDRIGKYTRFTIVRGKAPRRVDQCLVPGATRGSRCPSG